MVPDYIGFGSEEDTLLFEALRNVLGQDDVYHFFLTKHSSLLRAFSILKHDFIPKLMRITIFYT